MCLEVMKFVFGFLITISGISIITIGAFIQVLYSSFYQFVDSKSLVGNQILISAGVFIVVVVLAVLALKCFCDAINHRYLQRVLAVLLLGILTLEIVGIATSTIGWWDERSSVETKLLDTICYYGTDEDSTSQWDKLQTELACCGVYGHEDWSAICRISTLPDSCCSDIYASGNDTNCSYMANITVHGMGCHEALWTRLNTNISAMKLIGMVFVLLQLLAVAMSCLKGDGSLFGNFVEAVAGLFLLTPR